MPRQRQPAQRPDPTALIVDAALRLAAARGWRAVSLADVAAEAGVGMLDLYQVFRSKSAILAAFRRRVDAAVLAGAGRDEGPGERPRDALFDTLMRRFDALLSHKAAVAAILADGPRDPLAALCGLPALLQSMAWMLEASGVPAGGWAGRVRVKLVLGIYLSVLHVWLADASPDMARTMAVLDRRLRRVEPLLALRRGADAGGGATALAGEA